MPFLSYVSALLFPPGPPPNPLSCTCIPATRNGQPRVSHLCPLITFCCPICGIGVQTAAGLEQAGGGEAGQTVCLRYLAAHQQNRPECGTGKNNFLISPPRRRRQGKLFNCCDQNYQRLFVLLLFIFQTMQNDGRLNC